MGFSDADQAEENDVGFVLDELETEEVLDLEAVDFLRPAPAEGVEGFDKREASGFDATDDGAVLAQGAFAFGELGEIIEVGEFLARGFGGQALEVLPDKGEAKVGEMAVEQGKVGGRFH
jgi:hypothetical protein